MLKEKIAIWFLKGLREDTFRRRIIFYKLKKEIKKMKSWKTTTSGIGGILTGLGMIAKALHDGDYSQFGAAISTIVIGIGLICARDFDKSSEQMGIK